MNEVLNPTLYKRLLATFKNVKVSHLGETQIRKITRNLSNEKLEMVFIQTGETYKICCPFCSDTRFRCNINYMYGQRNELGELMFHLAHCFNAGCPLSLHEKQAYLKLKDIITARNIKDLSKATIVQGKALDLDKVRTTWPGEVIRVDKLPNNHVARNYLEKDRDFDCDVIGRFYNVHWCYSSDNALCQDRLIIPIYHNKKMVGWQARPAFDTDWSSVRFPKYYTAPGTPKNHILYNLGNAVKYKTGVIVEGVTDVWRVGPNAVCTLGASFSKAQQDLFSANFADYSGILLYDPDIKEKAPKIWQSMFSIVNQLNAKFSGGFCSVTLPVGTDPGSMNRTILQNYIKEEAAKLKVVASWSKRCCDEK